jgi:hypothetical protein
VREQRLTLFFFQRRDGVRKKKGGKSFAFTRRSVAEIARRIGIGEFDSGPRFEARKRFVQLRLLDGDEQKMIVLRTCRLEAVLPELAVPRGFYIGRFPRVFRCLAFGYRNGHDKAATAEICRQHV